MVELTALHLSTSHGQRPSKEFTAPAKKSAWQDYELWENHNTSSLPPVWLGALSIANHYTNQSCISENCRAEYSAVKNPPSWADVAMRAQHCPRFRCCPTSGSRSCICSLQASRSLRLCLWPSSCPSNQELMQLKISAAVVDPFLSYSRAKSRQLQQSDLGPRHRYLINNQHITCINHPFRCCIRKSKVKSGDRQWLLLKYANAT